MSAKQKPAEKMSGRIRSKEFQPLKVCAKYTPPAIAIFYSNSKNPGKKYLHEIALPDVINTIPAVELYQNLLKVEPTFLNPKSISEKQIIRIIEHIVGKLKPSNSNIRAYAEAKTRPNTNDQQEIFAGKDEFEPVVINKELKASAAESEGPQYSDDFIEESQGNDKKSSKLSKLSKLSKAEVAEPELDLPENCAPEVDQQEPAPGQDEDIDYEQMDAAMQNEGIELPEGFQRVFVEDLGEELLMDPEGNLYDMNGNLIGQAASDDEEMQQPAEGGDEKYFENSAGKGEEEVDQ